MCHNTELQKISWNCLKVAVWSQLIKYSFCIHVFFPASVCFDYVYVIYALMTAINSRPTSRIIYEPLLSGHWPICESECLSDKVNGDWPHEGRNQKSAENMVLSCLAFLFLYNMDKYGGVV